MAWRFVRRGAGARGRRCGYRLAAAVRGGGAIGSLLYGVGARDVIAFAGGTAAGDDYRAGRVACAGLASVAGPIR